MPILVAGRLEYGAREKLLKLPEDMYSDLQRRLPAGRLPDRTQLEKETWWSASDTIMDEIELQTWTEVGLHVTLKKVKGLHYNPALPDSAKDLVKEASQTIVNVSVTGIGLLQMQSVTWLEDACTEHLQRNLDEGWRILAVCPPNDARRPTYIIGHAEVGRTACR